MLLFPVLDFGGVESVGVMQAMEMRQHRLRVCVVQRGGRAAAEIRAAGVPVDELDTPASIRNPRATFRLWRYLRRHRPEILHARTGAMTAHGLIAGALARVPVRIVEEVGTPNRHTIGRVVFPLLYRLATAVVAVSGSVADFLVRQDGVSPAKIRVIHNAIRPEYFHAASREPDGQFRMLAVGRLVPIKGFDVLIEAVAPILRSDRDVVLRIAGDGPELDRLKGLAASLGIERRVEFMGYRADVLDLLEHADAFILPSKSEGLPLSLVEAVAARVPVIATSVGGIPEVLPHWAHQWLVPPDDPAALREAVERLRGLSDEDRRQVADRLHEHARHQFTPEVFAGRLTELYRELLAGPS